MAQRRMFSNRIANSARFLQMPAESQLLYFHMVLRADDDGIVESYPVMKLLGIAPDSFKVLVAKGYIRQLNEDQVIVITDWSEHNSIRADRKVDSIYLPLLLKELPEAKIIEAKARADRPETAPEERTHQLGRPKNNGTKMGRHKLGKVRLGKVRTIPEDLVLPDWLNREAWSAWEVFRNEIGRKLTASTVRLQLKTLSKHKEDHAKMIYQSIERGWRGLFVLCKEKSGYSDVRDTRTNDQAIAHQKRVEKLIEDAEFEENAKRNEKLREIRGMRESLTKKLSR